MAGTTPCIRGTASYTRREVTEHLLLLSASAGPGPGGHRNLKPEDASGPPGPRGGEGGGEGTQEPTLPGRALSRGAACTRVKKRERGAHGPLLPARLTPALSAQLCLSVLTSRPGARREAGDTLQGTCGGAGGGAGSSQMRPGPSSVRRRLSNTETPYSWRRLQGRVLRHRRGRRTGPRHRPEGPRSTGKGRALRRSQTPPVTGWGCSHVTRPEHAEPRAERQPGWAQGRGVSAHAGGRPPGTFQNQTPDSRMAM